MHPSLSAVVKKQLGQTLIEVLIAMALVGVLALGISSASTIATRVSQQTERKNVALGIANEEMELVRSLSYNDVGFVTPQTGDPPGVLAYTETASRNNQTYTINRRVEYVNDPLTAQSQDYKKVQIIISWLEQNNVTRQAMIVSYLSEEEVCADQPCPPGFRFDRTLCACVPYTPPACSAPNSCQSFNDCNNGGGSIVPGFSCASGVCCSTPPPSCTDADNSYFCAPTIGDCINNSGVYLSTLSCAPSGGFCCAPSGPITCEQVGFSCVADENTCTSNGGTLQSFYDCSSSGGICCQLPSPCPTINHSCVPDTAACTNIGGNVNSNYSCSTQDGGVCCNTPTACESYPGYSCEADVNACASIGGSVMTSGVSCTTSGGGVCCVPPPDCTDSGFICLGNENACSVQGGSVQTGYECQGTNQVCCNLLTPTPTPTPTPSPTPTSNLCNGPMICATNECTTSSECQDDPGRANVAGPCYFKPLPGGRQQCGRNVQSWGCAAGQWSMHCADSYGNEGQACTNGCGWTPPASCTQLVCPDNSSCGPNWGGVMNICRANSYFISGGCVEQVNPVTNLLECVDTSDGTCLGAVCEPIPNVLCTGANCP